jgi:hypothetical protein
MKSLLITLLLCVAMAMLTPHVTAATLRTRISDDTHTLSIQIEGTTDGHAIRYAQTFDVSDMNPLQKELLTYRAFRSAGVMAPLHQISGCLTVAFGILAMLITGLIFARRRFHRARSIAIGS